MNRVDPQDPPSKPHTFRGNPRFTTDRSDIVSKRFHAVTGAGS